ncbi:MAG: hypothetical protein KDD61_11790 [Bdellovibrionales bacterium]|nr:hypothetical protein [Bdellovibrionales bacterium]
MFGKLTTCLSIFAPVSLALSVQMASAANSTTNMNLDPDQSSSSIKMPRAKSKKYDELNEITDAELRAKAGSRSKYSISGELSYYGSEISDPFREDTPNPDNNPGLHKTSMNGSLFGRYRIDKQATLGFGTGVSMLTPFHGVERFDMKDPRISYDVIYKTQSGIQAVTSTSLTYVTNPDYVEIGEIAGIGFYQAAKYRVGRWTWGASLSASAYYYDRGYQKSDGNAANYFLTLSPSFNYKFNDNVRFKTSFSRGIRNLRKANDWGAWDNRAATGKVGLGISVSKDVYLNPYLYFYPESFSWENTSLSFSTIFSIL